MLRGINAATEDLLQADPNWPWLVCVVWPEWEGKWRAVKKGEQKVPECFLPPEKAMGTIVLWLYLRVTLSGTT